MYMQIQIHSHIHGHCCWSVRKSCWTHCDPMECSTPDSLPFIIIHVFYKYIWYAVKMSMTSGDTHIAVVMVNSRNNTCFNHRHIKSPPAMWETRVQSLGWGDPLEEGMETHSSILAWRIPWTDEPGSLQYKGSQRVRHHWATQHSTHTHLRMHT